MVKYLLENGAKANCFYYSKLSSIQLGRTPLMIASYKGHNDIVKLLLKHGAKVNTRSKSFNETALLKAARNNKIKTVKILLKAGADINIPNRYDRTPLMYAAMNGYYKMTKFLLKNNANKYAKDEDGKTALDLAKERKRYNIIRILK